MEINYQNDNYKRIKKELKKGQKIDTVSCTFWFCNTGNVATILGY